MDILLNGEKTDTRGAATVADLIRRFELPPETILIEHNGVALHRREWSEKGVTDGDRIEIIRVVAGG
jgi:thiamine biosynthesis protein ThiS